ncbi:MAG: hypothetical protein H0U95_06120 [Bacteroidetes bacterium]|nr:hypothetical protein [Bacteroidota bacterium]
MKIKKILFFLLLFGCIGYFREFFFVNLNNIMFQKYYNHTDLPIPSVMSVFNSFSYQTLYYSKYFLSLLWIVLFFFANYMALKHLTEKKILLKILTYSYLLLLSLAAVAMIYGYFINGHLQDDEYTVSRWLLGIAQSPIICLILIASEKLNTKPTQS